MQRNPQIVNKDSYALLPVRLDQEITSNITMTDVHTVDARGPFHKEFKQVLVTSFALRLC